jgi:hypothetical protein
VDDIILQFVARKQEFLIPAILILRSLSGLQSTAASEKSNGMGITDEELIIDELFKEMTAIPFSRHVPNCSYRMLGLAIPI